MQGGALALQATLTKQADVGILSYEHVLTAAVQGKRIVAFYSVAQPAGEQRHRQRAS